MPAVTELPALKDVRDTISGLIGWEIEIQPGATPPAVGGDSLSLVGLYVDDHLQSAAVVVFDFPLAARLGAAIGLVPPGGADAAIEDHELSQLLRDNASEILNVLASVFNTDGHPHLKLYTVACTNDELRSDVKAIAVKAAPREDIAVDVPRYGKGTMSIVLV